MHGKGIYGDTETVFDHDALTGQLSPSPVDQIENSHRVRDAIVKSATREH